MNTNIKTTNSIGEFSEILKNTIQLLIRVDKNLSAIQNEMANVSTELKKLSDRVEKFKVCQPHIRNKNIFVSTYPRFVEENRLTSDSVNPNCKHTEIFPSLTY